jgi:two-component system sensor histidine kinase BaeS
MKSLLSKILVSLLVSVLIALTIVALLTRMSLQSGMADFIERQETLQLETLIPELTELYRQNGNWVFLRHSPRRWNQLLRMNRPPGGPPIPAGRRRGGDRPVGPDGSPPRGHVNLRGRLFLLDEQKQSVAGAVITHDELLPMEAIEVDGSPVGWLGFIPARAILPPEAQQFLHAQTRTLMVSLLIALTLVAGLGFVLARHLSRPVRQLAGTVEALSRGEYAARAQMETRDEISALGRNVNQLAETLEKNRSARRRWMAEIAHELRTPVAVLKGEIEALEDGVRPLDEKARVSLQEEVSQLARLIDDLQTLALSDVGALDFSFERVDISELLEQVCSVFEDRLMARKVSLERDFSESTWINGDSQRLRQLLHNLLENCCRYVEIQGRVKLSLKRRGENVELILDDSGPGVNPDQMDRLFERFYRAEESRSRLGGGSGLGLSICRNIVDAHQGSIRAENSDLGGLRILVMLPAA